VQRTLGMLRRGVAGAVVVRLDRRDRGDRDDQAVAGVDQLGQQRARDAQRAEHVGLPHPAPIVDVRRHHRFQPTGSASVVDQHIDPVQRGRQRRHLRVACDVGHNGGAADLVRERGDGALPPGHTNDVKALCCKRSRGRFADTRAGAGDHRDPVRR
jgi:hypothetical protein